MIDAVRVPPSACSTSQSMVMVRCPSAARSIDGAQRAPDQPLDLLAASARPRDAARVGRARQHRVLGGDPALAGLKAATPDPAAERRAVGRARAYLMMCVSLPSVSLLRNPGRCCWLSSSGVRLPGVVSLRPTPVAQRRSLPANASTPMFQLYTPGLTLPIVRAHRGRFTSRWPVVRGVSRLWPGRADAAQELLQQRRRAAPFQGV